MDVDFRQASARSRRDLFSGRYLFHFHTRLTDGTSALRDYFEFALEQKIERLIFFEHIRKRPTYDVAAFVSDVRALSEKHGIDAHIGFEAKLLPSGELDISDEHGALAAVVGIAEHGFPPDVALLRQALEAAFAWCRKLFPQAAAVWAHPGLTFFNLGLQPGSDPSYRSLLQYAQKAGILIERNLQHGLVPQDLASEMGLRSVVLGANAHSVDELDLWAKNHDNCHH